MRLARAHRRLDKAGLVLVQLDAVLEQRFRLDERLAGGQQQVRRPVLGLPALRGGRDSAADAQALAILRDPVRDTGPVPEQRLVRDRHHGASVVGELRHEQTIVDEGVDQLATLARGQVGPRRALATDRRLPVLSDAHERVQHLRQLGFDVVGELLEYGLRSLRQRTLDTTEVAIRGQGEHAVLRTALVQLLEGELQQGQDFPVPCSGIAQHVVEALAARRVLLESQACGIRRQADHLPDLAGVRRHEVVLPRAFLQRADLRVVGKPRIEVAAQGADDPDPPASCQPVDDLEERLPMPGRDLLLRVHLLHLIDDQREPGIGLALRLLLARQGIAYQRCRRLRRFPQYLRKLLGPLAFGVE